MAFLAGDERFNGHSEWMMINAVSGTLWPPVARNGYDEGYGSPVTFPLLPYPSSLTFLDRD